MPERKKVILRYVDSSVIAPMSTGTMGSEWLRANGVFDPAATWVGHQPMGFDVYAGLYSSYVVTKSEIRVTIAQDANEDVPIVWILDTDGDTTPVTDWKARAEVHKGTYGITTSSASGTHAYLVLTAKYDRAKNFPVLEDGQTALVTADPAEAMYYMFSAQAMDQLTTTVSSYDVMYEIVYEVEFFDPKDLTAN